MRVNQRQGADGSLVLVFPEYADGFAFVGLTYILVSQFNARPRGNGEFGREEARWDHEWPDGTAVRLLHHVDRGTEMSAADPASEARLARLADELAAVDLPTRWTPLPVSLLEIGQSLPRRAQPALWRRLMRALGIGPTAG